MLLYAHRGQAAVAGGAASLWGCYSYSLVLAPFPRPYSVDSHTLPGTQWNLQFECAQGHNRWDFLAAILECHMRILVVHSNNPSPQVAEAGLS